MFITFIHLYGDADHSVGTLSDDEVPGIIRYLRNSHRYYTEDVYPGIMESIRRISGEGSSEEALLIEKFFGDYLEEVKNHFEYEEDTVFPYIDQLLEEYLRRLQPGRRADIQWQNTRSITMI